MAEKMMCDLCGYRTVRCGMAGHFRGKHPEMDWTKHTDSLGQESKEERLARKLKRTIMK